MHRQGENANPRKVHIARPLSCFALALAQGQISKSWASRLWLTLQELERIYSTILFVMSMCATPCTTDRGQIVFAFYEVSKDGLTNDHLVYVELI